MKHRKKEKFVCVISFMFLASSPAFSATKYKIGDIGPGGGIIIHVEQPPYKSKRGFTYIEVSPTDVVTNAQWCNNSPLTIGGNTYWQNQPIGSGSEATATLVSKCSSGAAQAASSFVSSTGKSDWYLPTASEAQWIRPALISVGKGMPDSNIWTSSEFDAALAWVTDLRTGAQNMDYKQHHWAVRAIRKFR